MTLSRNVSCCCWISCPVVFIIGECFTINVYWKSGGAVLHEIFDKGTERQCQKACLTKPTCVAIGINEDGHCYMHHNIKDLRTRTWDLFWTEYRISREQCIEPVDGINIILFVFKWHYQR